MKPIFIFLSGKVGGSTKDDARTIFREHSLNPNSDILWLLHLEQRQMYLKRGNYWQTILAKPKIQQVFSSAKPYFRSHNYTEGIQAGLNKIQTLVQTGRLDIHYPVEDPVLVACAITFMTSLVICLICIPNPNTIRFEDLEDDGDDGADLDDGDDGDW
jgi:uncharacterized membrane protein YgcG